MQILCQIIVLHVQVPHSIDQLQYSPMYALHKISSNRVVGILHILSSSDTPRHFIDLVQVLRDARIIIQNFGDSLCFSDADARQYRGCKPSSNIDCHRWIEEEKVGPDKPKQVLHKGLFVLIFNEFFDVRICGIDYPSIICWPNERPVRYNRVIRLSSHEDPKVGLITVTVMKGIEPGDYIRSNDLAAMYKVVWHLYLLIMSDKRHFSCR